MVKHNFWSERIFNKKIVKYKFCIFPLIPKNHQIRTQEKKNFSILFFFKFFPWQNLYFVFFHIYHKIIISFFIGKFSINFFSCLLIYLTNFCCSKLFQFGSINPKLNIKIKKNLSNTSDQGNIFKKLNYIWWISIFFLIVKAPFQIDE